MTAVEILQTAEGMGLRITAQDGALRISPASQAAPEFVDSLRENKHELIQLLSGRGEQPAPLIDDSYNEWCWAQIVPADYEYLTGPRNWPSPCQWCGGRMRHHPLCYAQHPCQAITKEDRRPLHLQKKQRVKRTFWD